MFGEGLLHAGRYNSLFLIFLFAPKITNLKKSGMMSIFTSSIIIFLVIFIIFTIIPYPQILDNYFAFYEITRTISYGRFFQRVEVIFTFIWLFISLLYLTTSVCIILYTAKRAFHIEFPRFILPLLATSAIALTTILPNFTPLLVARDLLYMYVTPIIVFLYPFFLLVISRLKTSGINEQNQRKEGS